MTVTRPAQVTGALGTGFVRVEAAERVPFPATKGTALLDPERVFSPTAYNSGGGGMSGSDMGSMMEDPAFLQRAKTFMSEMMSDPTLQEQMRSMMGDMGDMSGMGGMAGEDDPGNP